MLASFQIDEFAQYPSLLRMTTAAAGETLHNLYYYCGYPFYVASTLAVLPVKLAISAFGGARHPASNAGAAGTQPRFHGRYVDHQRKWDCDELAAPPTFPMWSGCCRSASVRQVVDENDRHPVFWSTCSASCPGHRATC